MLAALLLISLLLLWGQSSQVAAADNFSELSAAIQAANSSGSDEITLSGDITLSAALPAITGSLTIEGDGHTISGDDAYRIFDVNGGALTLTNVTLTEGNAARAARRTSSSDETPPLTITGISTDSASAALESTFAPDNMPSRWMSVCMSAATPAAAT